MLVSNGLEVCLHVNFLEIAKTIIVKIENLILQCVLLPDIWSRDALDMARQ